MKILFVTARFPYPPVKGDQAVPYYRLKYLGTSHEITLVTFYETKRELAHVDKIKPFCKELVTVKKSFIRSLLNMMAKGFFSKRPFQVLYYRSNAFKKALARVLETGSFDLLHVYMLRMAEYGETVQLPKVLELIDSMELNFQRRLQMERFPRDLLFKVELDRLKRYETRMVNRYDRAVVVSETDKACIGRDNVVHIGLGVNTDEFRPKDKAKNKLPAGKVIAFTGNMGYFPNENAVLWFMENCFDAIREKVPGVRLIVAGKDPGAKIRRFHDGETVEVTGEVDSIAAVLNNARVAIAPMQSGSGMQFKILEAMACGLPVVTTSMGLGSIAARHDESVLVADDPGTFTGACVRLLVDDPLAARIGGNAEKRVKETYTWEQNVAGLLQVYDEVLNAEKETR